MMSQVCISTVFDFLKHLPIMKNVPKTSLTRHLKMNKKRSKRFFELYAKVVFLRFLLKITFVVGVRNSESKSTLCSGLRLPYPAPEIQSYLE